MDLGLKGKVALVAGASKGLGKAVALALAREGASVAILSRDQSRVQAAAKELQEATGARVVGVAADVSRLGDIKRAVDVTANEFGTIHILVTNAGGPPPGSGLNLTDEQWRQAVDLTLLSAVRLSQAVVPYMQKNKWGRILHLGSFTVKYPAENLMLSNSIRAAVVGLGKTQADELGQYNITVNSVLPGWTETERVSQLLKDRAERGKTTVEQARGSITKEIPLGRMGKPEEFANAVVFLASERASYIDGVYLLVDGGITPTPF